MDKNNLWRVLKDHIGHEIEIAVYGDIDDPANISLEDLDTGSVILDAELYTICGKEDDALWNLLKDHFDHKVEISGHGDIDDPKKITLTDLDTGNVILDTENCMICARTGRLILYRYKISMGYMIREEIDIVKETPKCYFGKYCRILKKDDGIPVLKDRTTYPFIDFYSTKDPSREFAVEKILEFFRGEMR